ADTSATRTFTVDDASQISSATLTYYITCNSDEKGVLTISMNDQEAFADRVFCQYLDQRELNLDVASLKDSNNLKFEITKGDYNIEEAMITLKTKQKDYPKFTFDISSNDFKAIQAGTKDLYLQMTFSPDSGEKRAAVLIQGNSFNFDTEADTYERKISSYIDDGANTITLEPSTSFIIDNLKVYVK
ncbi:hypothetical protein HZA98_01960, partial [Candidatus Woesearchaeota archaeon]|nr:hypothetical protein [Candidatus Woesearchaeota archaeon]